LSALVPPLGADVIRRQVVIGASAISPDGERVVYTRRTVAGDRYQVNLWLVPYCGGRPRRLTHGRWSDSAPAWSPDGRTIAFSRLAGADDGLRAATLYLADADGSNVRQLGATPLHGVSAAWSPDGTRLAFVSFDDGNDPRCPLSSCPPSGELYAVRTDGSGLTRLTQSRADDEHPTWSPDGRRIAFASGYDLRSQGHAPWLMAIGAGGGRATRIGKVSGVLDPAWSR
jgi:Tol biopolymer transport system component